MQGLGHAGSVLGNGDQHGTTLATDTHNYAAGSCADTSVRVYHDKTERAGEGHHCKQVSSNNCQCRCHSMFRGTYNTATLELNGDFDAYNPRSSEAPWDSYDNSQFGYSVPVTQDDVAGTPY